ncbi:NADH-quinone oxidoreductase subunit L [Candidatus Venteria ishoeyi]|uniref:NADH-quinone oxidoreductase subunit L n=1 Tax=Candidatus Venteria ishoeyi TaxID=1899563 RepID=A0A1H6FFS6_9GAMM|nr:NADH-quinone oxidoreductase subunit L [Candidatus Venteria ishoeyi]MDM8546158.1 NADH-quinone oxidoreductase subunit L [Candidatus Venteria ishoeyi]SEH08026.1 NADH-quinone oxidoreductase subunit L [Candidatus Venteria ishoeyi]
MESIALIIVLAPLAGAILAGLFSVSRKVAHRITITGVGLSFILSLVVFKQVVLDGLLPFADGTAKEVTLYTWLSSGNSIFEIGFLIDSLTAIMMVTVTFVSWMVHIYTIGYMADDEHNWSGPGGAGKNSYQRFFSYISLFTFSMLMLVMANNFLQLFFGWEAVGLVSYLLIGFWFQRETAVYANLKAFLVNRVGDFGFLLGIAAVLMYFNSLNYADVFANANNLAGISIQVFPGVEWSLMTVICILLFIGAMGKSAQFPLHVWLPDSMEGPTPISALIHAATMVTAGIFMVARMSPLYELSTTALSFVLVIGAITALFMGFLGLVQNDIKRVVAYSTLSQLGYMTVALGASAYNAAIFHLMTHAFFKALLFLGAGSVIIAMHHEQDMRKMGGLKKYLPITYWTALIGSLALIGFPGFSGFFSKDAIIEAVHFAYEADRPGAMFAYYSVVIGVFITALYSFRMFFLTFHGQERMDEHTRSHLHEPPKVVTLPLILLAIPSVLVGVIALQALLYGNFFGDAIYIAKEHQVFTDYHGILGFVLHGLMQPPVYLAAAGVFTAYMLYMKWTDIPARIQHRFSMLHRILMDKYGFDRFNDWFFAGGARQTGNLFSSIGDKTIIDGFFVNGSAHLVNRISGILRQLQTGLLYQYAFAMIIGLLLLLGWFVHF